MSHNVLITTSSFGKYDQRPLQLLQKAGLHYTLNPHGRTLTGKELLNLVDHAIGIIAGTEKLDANMLAKLPGVKVISRCGSGLDSIDVEAARNLSIIIKNTPDSSTTAVAELTVGLLLSLLRKLYLMNAELKAGQWHKKMGSLLAGKKVGIIGFGRIGQKVGQLLSAFGTEITFYDTAVKSSQFAHYLGLHELLQESDIICLHVSKSAGSHYLLGEQEILMIKNGAWVVNCARGGIVNERPLYEALKKGRLSGAALDVFEREPYTGPLRDLDNVILTPHIGSYAREARIQMEIEAVRNLLQSLEGVL